MRRCDSGDTSWKRGREVSGVGGEGVCGVFVLCILVSLPFGGAHLFFDGFEGKPSGKPQVDFGETILAANKKFELLLGQEVSIWLWNVEPPHVRWTGIPK